jgi:DNA-binding response OmpR family regulator
MKLLLVEDDPNVRRLLTDYLRSSKYDVRSVATGSAGLSETVSWRPDLIVLDLGLPDLDGESLLRMIRAIYSAPVLIVTAHADEETTIRLLHAGADDYLIKPFSPPHLGARVEAVLRRAGMSTPSAPLAVGELEVDLASRVATLGGEQLSLSRKEFDLLAHLARRAGQVVSRRELLREVWQLPSGDDDQTIDVHLSWLRRKLGETAQAPRYLHTVRGVGIKLEPPVTTPGPPRE